MELLVKCIFELVGTMVMILLGDGVCASTSLSKSKSQGAGWVVITLAWGFAVMVGVLIAGPYSGAHLNPAVTLGLAIAGSFPWAEVAPYICAQMIGGFLGGLLVYVFWRDHFKATEGDVLCIFCTMPAIDHKIQNFLCELIATWVLVFVILWIGASGNSFMIGGAAAQTGAIGAFPVTALIMAIGMSLGGATGYALNPARDLSPRLVHQLIFKRDSGWAYSWVPVAGPLAGAALGAGCFLLISILL
ncbi:MAG: aquaporin family protein [Bacteroidales bacterium]|nr:aquaporin family protein [Bacteroidales bacterium]